MPPEFSTAGLQVDDPADLAFIREELIRALGEEAYWRIERVDAETEEPQRETAEAKVRRKYGAGCWEPDVDEPGAAEHAGKDGPVEELSIDVKQPESEQESSHKSEAEAEQQSPPGGSDTGTSIRADPRRGNRFVDIDEIKRAAQGRGTELLHALGIMWHNGGPTHILCPFHDDHDPSFRWDEAKDCCFCTCDISGNDIIAIVQRRKDLDFAGAKVWIAEQLGRHDLIREADDAQGCTLQQVADAKKLPIEHLRKLGWFDQARYGKFHRPAVGIPYTDRNNNRNWLRYRVALQSEDGKKRFFWRKGDKGAPLYGSHLAAHLPDAGYAFLVEGESDTATLLYNNVPAQGIPGADNWNEDRHATNFDGVDRIYIPIEPDQGGERVLDWLARSRIRSRALLIFMTPEAKDINVLWCKNPDRDAFMATLLELEATAEPFNEAKHAPPKHEPAQEETRSRRRREEAQHSGPIPLRGLPVIEYAGGKLAEATDKAERILAESDHEIFQRSDFLVRLGFAEDMTAADGEKIKGPRLVTVDAMHLQYRMNKYIDFQKFDERMEDYKSINPPRDVAESLRQLKGLWKNISGIDGLTTAPIFRADGSIMDQPGFDPLTRVLYVPTPGVTFCPIPPKPTEEQARAALGILCDLIAEFPFIQENGDIATGKPSPSRSVALSGLITPMVRRAILSAPIHAFDATEAGSGKSKLCSLPSIIARGHAAPVIPGGSELNPEEFEKKISTSLIAADAIVVIDNVEGHLSSELLCSAATERMLYIRVLGLSKNILVPNGATFFVNGNGLTIIGDLVRRSIRTGLDPKVDRPELRTFAQPDPVLRALRDRPVYVAAILTVLRAFHVAGRPKQQEPLGSFEDWSRLVRDCLIWLGEPDPCETMERTRKQDPRRRALADILYWWNTVMGRHEVTAKRVIEYAEEREQPQSKTDFNTPPLRYPEFREALMTVAAGKDGSVDPVRFGKWLGRNAMKFVDGLRIEPGLALDHSGSGRWKVVPA